MSKRELRQIRAQTPRRSGRGTHGSLTKAGKVRDMTNQYMKGFKGKPRRKTTPLTENRRKYRNRFLRPKQTRRR